MTLRISISSLLSLILGGALFVAARPIAGFAAKDATVAIQDNRADDAAAIRAHIGSIFQAFIDWDVDKIYATHSIDWRGFLEGSRVPIKGIDEYMRANGIDWPKEKGSKPSPDPNRAYRIKDFDVNFYGPDLAVASFIGEFERKNGTSAPVTTNRLHLMDVYAKRQ